MTVAQELCSNQPRSAEVSGHFGHAEVS